MRGAVRRWVLIGMAAGAALTAGNLFHPTVVVGSSMEPTLADGKVVWVDRFHYGKHPPKRGEVVVFRLNGQTYIKRVYRGPGETVHYLECDGEWMAPIRETRRDQMRAMTRRSGASAFKIREIPVPKDAIFVLGDNLHESEDSRKFGPVPLSAIIGRAHVDVDCTAALQYELAPQRGIHSFQSQPGQAGAPQPHVEADADHLQLSRG